MKTILLFICTDPDQRDVRSHCEIEHAPEFALGDTFELSIFGDFGQAEVVHRHFRSQRTDVIITCEVGVFLSKHLANQKFAISGVNEFELPPQEW